MSYSVVWKFFTKCSDTEAKCCLCSKQFRTGGGTTNLRQHLKMKHPASLEDKDFLVPSTDVTVSDGPKVARKRRGVEWAHRFSEVRNCGRPKEEDEFDAFGRVVSISLKKLPLALALAAQTELQDVVTKFRLKALDQALSGVESQPEVPEVSDSTSAPIQHCPNDIRFAQIVHVCMSDENTAINKTF